MFFEYLEKMADLLQKKDVENLVKQLTDVKEIEKMFKEDVEYIIRKYKEGEISRDEAEKNFNLLKAYILSQLRIHFDKVKEMAKHYGVNYFDEEIEDEFLRNLMEFLTDYEEKI